MSVRVHQTAALARHEAAGIYCRVLVLFIVAATLAACRTASLDPLAVADAQTAVRVKTALVNDPDLGGITIEVRVVGGVARLSGAVGSQAHIDRAEALTRAVQGVSRVQLDLRIGATFPPPSTSPDPAPLGRLDGAENDHRGLAVGVSVGISDPRERSLTSRVSVGPLFRLGSGKGLGPAIALGWFRTTLPGDPRQPDVASRIGVKPIMAGLSYTLASRRVSVSPSLVAGIAFNTVTVPDSGHADRVAVKVANSLVWRPGVSAWFDVSPRVAFNLSLSHVVTGLPVTFLEDGALVKRTVNGNTTIMRAGMAYKIF